MQDVTAREIMSKTVHQVSPELRLIDLERELTSHRISGAPVVDGGNVVGIVSRSDIDRHLSHEESRVAAAAAFYQATFSEDEAPTTAVDPSSSALESLRNTVVREIMTPEVISVTAGERIGRVAELMRQRRIHRVLVIENGDLLGLVSSLDIVGAVADRVE